jgi:hypothetical protein
MGHIAKFFPAIREEYKRKHKRLHAHVVEYEEPPAKMIREQIRDHVLISALSGSVTLERTLGPLIVVHPST